MNHMLGAILAISTAFMQAVGVALISRRLSGQNFYSSVMIITLVGNIVFWPILILAPENPINIYGLALFAVAGLFYPGLARLSYQVGMLKVGLAANASIFATNSLFAALFAILLLNEMITPILFLGILLVAIGASLIGGSLNNDSTGKIISKGMAKNLLLPSSGAVSVGLGVTLRKFGLNTFNNPLTGLCVAYFTDLTFFVLLFSISPKIRNVAPVNSGTLRLFWKGGLCIAIGSLLGFYAVQSGSVVAVTPLLQTEPLFVLLISYLFLRGREKLSAKLVIGTINIVLGVMLVTFFQV